MSGTKIRMIRGMRGFSQAYMADKLGMTQSNYSRIESNQSKLDVDLIEKIAKELGVNPVDILSNEPTVVNFAANQGTQGIGHIEHFHSFQKDLVEKIIISKDQEIGSLKEVIASQKEVIASLVTDKETLMNWLREQKEKG